MQSTLQEKFSYTVVVRGLLSGGSVRQIRAFVVVIEMDRGGMSVVAAAAFAISSAVSLPGVSLWPGTQMRMLGPLPLSHS